MKTKRLYLIGEIDHTNYESFTRDLRECEEDNVDRVILELSSDGGDGDIGLAIASRIRLSPCEIHIVATGLIASAASIILAYGDYRIMAKEAWFMVHEEAMKINSRISELESEITRARLVEDQYNRLLSERSRLTFEEWEKYSKNTTYFSAEECLDIGVIDEII